MLYEISFIVFCSLLYGLFTPLTGVNKRKNRHLGSLLTFVVIYLTIKMLNSSLDITDLYRVTAVICGFFVGFLFIKMKG
jgi:hypothetical protein